MTRCVPRAVCSSICQRRRGGVVGCDRAMVEQLHHGGEAGIDAGANPSLLLVGTASMARSALFPS